MFLNFKKEFPLIVEIGLKHFYPNECIAENITDEQINEIQNKMVCMLKSFNELRFACSKQIDGHFWVERDGEIIDTTTQAYGFQENQNERNDAVAGYAETNYKINKKKILKVLKAETLTYLEAPQITQMIMVASILKPLRNAFGGNTKLAMDVLKVMDYKPKYGQCDLNALFEYAQNGGDIKFGSIASVVLDFPQWIYGDDSYKTVKDFYSEDAVRTQIKQIQWINDVCKKCLTEA